MENGEVNSTLLIFRPNPLRRFWIVPRKRILQLVDARKMKGLMATREIIYFLILMQILD